MTARACANIALTVSLIWAAAWQALPLAADDFSGLPPAENLIENGSFETPEFSGWSLVIAGDRAGSITSADEAWDGEGAAEVRAPTDRSWAFLRQHGFEVGMGEGLVLTACVKSSSSRAKLVLTCGYLWGGAPSGHTTRAAHHSGSGDWELLRTAISVNELPVSAAVGFDYNSAGQTLIVDDVRLEREADALMRDALACAARFERLAARGDLSEALRRALASQAQRGRELVSAFAASSREEEGWQAQLEELRAYADSERQLITWSGDREAGEEGSLAAEHIRATIRPYGADRAVLGLMNAFGEHSVAVRIAASALADETGQAGIAADRVRLAEVVPTGREGLVTFAPLGEASLIIAPPGEARRVVLRFDLRDVKPGTYRGTLRLVPLDREQAGPPQVIPLELTI